MPDLKSSECSTHGASSPAILPPLTIESENPRRARVFTLHLGKTNWKKHFISQSGLVCEDAIVGSRHHYLLSFNLDLIRLSLPFYLDKTEEVKHFVQSFGFSDARGLALAVEVRPLAGLNEVGPVEWMQMRAAPEQIELRPA